MKNKLLIVLSLLIVSVGAQAKLAGKNVVLVHGFNPLDLLERPADSELQGRANNYWNEYWLNKAEANLYWASTDRISGGIKDDIQDQFQELAANGTCRDGCVFVTHSTGDLVTRYALSKLGQWGISSNDFKVLAVLDFAGAGGGTELADLAVSVTSGFGLINSVQRAAINTFLGFDADAGLLGVLYDLRPATARSTATANNSVPRLRFVGAGSQYLGITKPFILGSDDAVVPMHSACGATSKSAYDSCSRSIKNNGVISYVSKAPSSLMYNHYAVLMGEKTNHSDAINNSRSGNFTTVSNNTTKGVNVDFATKTSRKWWSWGKKVRWVTNGDRKSMSANVFDTLNN
jgi:hypothetical protein